MSVKPRVLIVKLSSLGDLFHALPAVHAIKQGLDAVIHWVVQAPYVELVRCFDDVDEVFPFHRKAAIRSAPALMGLLRANAYDYAIDLQGLMKSALVARLAGACRCLGPSYQREGSFLLYHRVAPAGGDIDRHAVDKALDVLALLNLTPGERRFPVTFPRAGLNDVRPRIALAPQSRWLTKNWPAERFVEAGQLLQATHGGTLYLLGGQEDVELAAWMERQLSGPVRNLAGQSSLVETGGILSEMDLLLSNDSGPIHMAVAAGTRTVTIFGATNPLRTGAYGSGHIALGSDISCRPCLSETCRRGDRQCLLDVTVDPVVARASAALREAGY